MNKLIKVFLVVLFSFLLLSNCSETISEDEVITNSDNGLVYKKSSTDPYTGSITPTLENPNTRYFKNGKTHGFWVAFHENGKLRARANYKDGKTDGLYEEYYKNGQLKWKVVHKDGKRHGNIEMYYENGRLFFKGTFKNDYQRDGTWKSYYENGRLRNKEIYKDEKPEGLWVYYHENGNLDFKRSFKDGKYHGLHEEYHENGQLEQKGYYKDEKKNGYWKYLYENGQLRMEGAYIDGQKHGLWKFYYENGNLKIKRHYQNGTKFGDDIFYLESGELITSGMIVSNIRRTINQGCHMGACSWKNFISVKDSRFPQDTFSWSVRKQSPETNFVKSFVVEVESQFGSTSHNCYYGEYEGERESFNRILCSELNPKIEDHYEDEEYPSNFDGLTFKYQKYIFWDYSRIIYHCSKEFPLMADGNNLDEELRVIQFDDWYHAFYLYARYFYFCHNVDYLESEYGRDYVGLAKKFGYPEYVYDNKISISSPRLNSWYDLVADTDLNGYLN
jgi:antitoxin component YwqK of YwqJK toxin-antitoxin module